MSGIPRASAGLLGMISAPASCFLLSPRLLPSALLFPVLGLIRWRLGWLATLAAVSAAPLLIALWSAATGRVDSTETALRWALAAGCGIYFARRAGAVSTGRRLLSWGDRIGPPAGRFLGDLGEVLLSSEAVRASMKGVHATKTPPAEILRRLRSAVRSSCESPAAQAADPPEDGFLVLEAAASWMLLLLGTAGF